MTDQPNGGTAPAVILVPSREIGLVCEFAAPAATSPDGKPDQTDIGGSFANGQPFKAERIYRLRKELSNERVPTWGAKLRSRTNKECGWVRVEWLDEVLEVLDSGHQVECEVKKRGPA